MSSVFGGNDATRPVTMQTILDSWRFGTLPRNERKPTRGTISMPLRLIADKTGDGKLSVFVMAIPAKSPSCARSAVWIST